MTHVEQELVYCLWRDACHHMDEHDLEKLGDLAELHAVGWLLKETPESITLGSESQDGMTSARLWITIPKVNIVEMIRTTADKAFRLTKPRIRKPKKAKVTPSASTEVPLA